MNSNLKIFIHFLLLIPLQVLIANHIRLFGFINPQLCVLFVIWHPLERKSTSFLLYAFVFGLLLDIFSNSGGVNIAAILLIAFIKRALLKIITSNKELELSTFRYDSLNSFQRVFFIFILVILHQLIIYSLEYYHYTYFFKIIYKSVITGVFTTFLVTIFVFIFKPSHRI